VTLAREIPAGGATGRPGDGIFADYGPPFDLTADFLFVMALAPSEPLRRAFPRVPFLALLGRTPLLCWLSRVSRACYYDRDGRPRCEGGPDVDLYYELNVIAPLWRRAFFVPGIYVTSELSLRLGHGYHMPKQLSTASLARDGDALAARVREGPRTPGGLETGGRETRVRARLLGCGERMTRWLAARLPFDVWPAYFPRRGRVRPRLTRVGRVQPARVEGTLALTAPWLPRPVPFLGLGLFAAGLGMRLPPPGR
jgi:hypothetical protein